jgi:hypothetical protein
MIVQGTGAGQDPRFKDKTKRLLKNIKSSAPKEYEKKVRMEANYDITRKSKIKNNDVSLFC